MSEFYSIVVPTRNRADVLADCIDDLLSLRFAPDRLEIIVADDASEDATQDVVMRRKFGRIPVRYTSTAVRGPNAARNAGIKLSTGSIICFLDDDVRVPENWLEETSKAMAKYPTIDCFGGRIRLRLGRELPRSCPDEPIGETELELGPEIVEPEYVWSANMMVRRRAFDSVGLFDPSLPYWGDETEWEFRYKRAGGRILYLPDAWVWHRRGPKELHPWRMLKGRFLRGRSSAKTAGHFDARASVAGALWRALMGIKHAIQRRCWIGLLTMSFNLGAGYESARLLLRRRAPSYISWWPRKSAREVLSHHFEQ